MRKGNTQDRTKIETNDIERRNNWIQFLSTKEMTLLNDPFVNDSNKNRKHGIERCTEFLVLQLLSLFKMCLLYLV